MQISTEQTEAMRMANGTIERKCLKRHNRAEGCCSPRCLRWYPRVECRAPDGSRKFDYLGGYRQLLQHHVRPYLGERPITSLGTLQVQELYNQLARAGRKDGKPGGL